MVLVTLDEDASEGSMESRETMKESKAKLEHFAPIQEASSSANDSYVLRAVDEFNVHSSLQCRPIPDVKWEDIRVGEVIGKGGFAQVNAVSWNGRSNLALKRLRDSVKEGDPKKLEIASADLIKEAMFLASLQHPNIIGIHAQHVDLDLPSETFMILDRLDQTLVHRMEEWYERDMKLLRRNPKQRVTFLKERLHVCLDICKTLQYLHQRDVIYRDLKAENLGFDEDGNVKLYDFGLAKELKDDHKSATGKYKLSGNTGSLAYMAPEVAKGWKYDKTVDVYSFGILTWEICALQNAFPDHKTADSMHNVWAGEERPPLEEWWPVELSWLLKKCWSYFAKSRPDFGVIAETLEEILDEGPMAEEESARSIASFRFGSRRSQMLSQDSNSRVRPTTLRPHDLVSVQPVPPRKKFLGIF